MLVSCLGIHTLSLSIFLSPFDCLFSQCVAFSHGENVLEFSLCLCFYLFLCVCVCVFVYVGMCLFVCEFVLF